MAQTLKRLQEDSKLKKRLSGVPPQWSAHLSRSSGISSAPIWPLAPVTRNLRGQSWMHQSLTHHEQPHASRLQEELWKQS